MDDLNETFKQLKTPKDSQTLLSVQKFFNAVQNSPVGRNGHYRFAIRHFYFES